MARRFDLLWRLLDVPSGAVLGVLSGSFVIMAWISFFYPTFTIPEGFLGGYGMALGGVTVNGIAKKMAGKREAENAKVDSPDTP